MANRFSMRSLISGLVAVLSAPLPVWFIGGALEHYGARAILFGWAERVMPSIATFIYEFIVIMLCGMPFLLAGWIACWWGYARPLEKEFQAEEASKRAAYNMQSIGIKCVDLSSDLQKREYTSGFAFRPNEWARIHDAFNNIQNLGLPVPKKEENGDFMPEISLRYLIEVGPFLQLGLLDKAKERAIRFLKQPSRQ